VAAVDAGRQSLKGVKGVFITVEPLAPEIERDGLTQRLIRKSVEVRLRRAGIKVLSKVEWFEEGGHPLLYVNAHVLRLAESKEYIYAINVAVKQNVYLTREPIQIPSAATWWPGSVAGITPKLSAVRDAINKQVDAFIQAYYSVNRK
jgi:hypothetical protein